MTYPMAVNDLISQIYAFGHADCTASITITVPEIVITAGPSLVPNGFPLPVNITGAPTIFTETVSNDPGAVLFNMRWELGDDQWAAFYSWDMIVSNIRFRGRTFAPPPASPSTLYDYGEMPAISIFYDGASLPSTVVESNIILDQLHFDQFRATGGPVVSDATISSLAVGVWGFSKVGVRNCHVNDYFADASVAGVIGPIYQMGGALRVTDSTFSGLDSEAGAVLMALIPGFTAMSGAGSAMKLQVAGSTFTNNTIRTSGAAVSMINYEIGANKMDVVISHCDFRNNHADDSGGAISLVGANSIEYDVAISHSNFTNSSSSSLGGAINIDIQHTLLFSTSHCLVKDSLSSGSGGAIRIGAKILQANFNHTIFEGNRVQTNAYGGAIWVQSTTAVVALKFHNSVLHGGTYTTVDGGGFLFAQALNSITVRVTNCEVSSNSALGGGGFLKAESVAGSILVDFADSNVHDNTVPTGRGGVLDLYAGPARTILINALSTNFSNNFAFTGGSVIRLTSLNPTDIAFDVRECLFYNTFEPAFTLAWAIEVYLTGISGVHDYVFEDSKFENLGGGVLKTRDAATSCHMDISRCVFTGNGKAGITHGGIDVGVFAGAVQDHVLTVSNSTFEDNHGPQGGAISTDYVTTLESSIFRGNYAGTSGGAVYVANYQPDVRLSGVNISTCNFHGNSAEQTGGDIVFKIEGEVFISNTWFDQSRSWRGGSVYVDDNFVSLPIGGGDPKFTVEYSSWTNCSTNETLVPSARGGAFYIKAPNFDGTFNRCTFAGNRAGVDKAPAAGTPDEGAVFYFATEQASDHQTFFVNQTTFTGNDADNATIFACNLELNGTAERCIFGNNGADVYTKRGHSVTDGGGNVSDKDVNETLGYQVPMPFCDSSMEVCLDPLLENPTVGQELGPLEIFAGYPDMNTPARFPSPNLILNYELPVSWMPVPSEKDQAMAPFSDCIDDSDCAYVGRSPGSIQGFNTPSPTPLPTPSPTASLSPSPTPSPSPSPFNTVFSLTPLPLQSPLPTPSDSPSPSPSALDGGNYPSPSPSPQTHTPHITPPLSSPIPSPTPEETPHTSPVPTPTLLFSSLDVEPSSGLEGTTFTFTFQRTPRRRSKDKRDARAVEAVNGYNLLYMFSGAPLNANGLPDSGEGYTIFDDPQSDRVLQISSLPVGDIKVWGLTWDGISGEYVTMPVPVEVSITLPASSDCETILEQVRQLVENGLLEEASSLLATFAEVAHEASDLDCAEQIVEESHEIEEQDDSNTTLYSIIETNVIVGSIVIPDPKRRDEDQVDEIVNEILENIVDALTQIVEAGGDIPISDRTISQVVTLLDEVGDYYTNDRNAINETTAELYREVIETLKTAAVQEGFTRNLDSDTCKFFNSYSHGTTTITAAASGENLFQQASGDGEFSFNKDAIDSLKTDLGCVYRTQATIQYFIPCASECCKDRVSPVESFTFYNASDAIFDTINFSELSRGDDDHSKVYFTIPYGGDFSQQSTERETYTTDDSCGSSVTKTRKVKQEPLCQYFEEKSGCFSESGCKVVKVTGKGVDCVCNHLTDFAVVLGSNADGGGGGGGGDCGSDDFEWDTIMILSMVSIGVAFCFVLVVIVVFTYVRRFRRTVLGTEGARVEKLQNHMKDRRKGGDMDSGRGDGGVYIPQTKRSKAGVADAGQGFQAMNPMSASRSGGNNEDGIL